MTRRNPPQVDHRTQAQFTRDLIRRIPTHSPDWTDHNASDPGRVLIELFGWMSENLVYRMNRVPERAHAEYLRLLGIAPRDAEVAVAWIQLDPGRSTDATVLPYGGSSTRAVFSTGKLRYQVRDEVVVLPIEAQSFAKVLEELPEEPDRTHGVEGLRQLLEDHVLADGESLPEDFEPRRPYSTRELPPAVGGVVPPVTDFGATLDETLWIALMTPKSVDRAVAAELGVENPSKMSLADRVFVFREIRRRLAGRVVSIAVRVDDDLCGADDHFLCDDGRDGAERLPLEWTIAEGADDATGADVDLNGIRYRRLVVEADQTAGLARSGVVKLRLPRREADFGAWWADRLPVRGLQGIGDLPPLLEDPKDDSRVVAWVRCRRPIGALAPPPHIRWVGINVVEVEQAVTAAPEVLGFGDGRPGQRFPLSRKPVIPGSVLIESHHAGESTRWDRVPDLRVSGAGDDHYELDALTGELFFGDGVNGRIPRLGEEFRARSFRYGGGAAGNAPAGSIKKIDVFPNPQPGARASATRPKASNPFSAAGGRDAETVAAATARIPQALRHRERAVATTDFKDLTFETPGVHVGRVEVLPLHKPHERADGIPGVVSLVVLPAYDPLHPDQPVPDRNMMSRICAHLEPRRLVTTELYITPPEYMPIWISVCIEVAEGYGYETVARWVDLAIRQYFAPLAPYGPGGEGWPFGRDVREGDVEAAALRVEGVRLVRGQILVGFEKPAHTDPVDVAGTIRLERWQLPVIREVLVSSDEEGVTPFALEEIDFNPDAGGVSRPADQAARAAATSGSGSDPGTGGSGSTPNDIPVPLLEDPC